MTSPPKLRWAIFTSSVLSTVGNPDAYLWRTLGRLLRQHGHEAVFYEPRGNAALRALLHQSGSRALHQFRDQYPEIEYRTLEPRAGADLVEWMTRTLATADVAVIQSTAAPVLIEWLGKLTRPHLQTFFVDTGWNGPAPGDRGLAGQLRDFSAVLAGSENVADIYRAALTTATAVQSIGPLPEPRSDSTLTTEDTVALNAACERLVEAVTAVHLAARTGQGPVIGPNGDRRPDTFP